MQELCKCGNVHLSPPSPAGDASCDPSHPDARLVAVCKADSRGSPESAPVSSLGWDPGLGGERSRNADAWVLLAHNGVARRSGERNASPRGLDRRARRNRGTRRGTTDASDWLKVGSDACARRELASWMAVVVTKSPFPEQPDSPRLLRDHVIGDTGSNRGSDPRVPTRCLLRARLSDGGIRLRRVVHHPTKEDPHGCHHRNVYGRDADPPVQG